MKKNKILSLILAITLTASMMLPMGALTASAAGEKATLTVTGPSSITLVAADFTAYKLFDVTVSAGTPVSYAYTPVQPQVNNFLASAYNHTGTSNADDFKAYLEGSLTQDQLTSLTNDIIWFGSYGGFPKIAAAQSAPPNRANVEFDNLDYGYYLVEGSMQSVLNGINVIAHASLVTVDAPTKQITLKADAPSMTKQVLNDNIGAWSDWTDSQIGDTDEFQLTSRVPDMLGYKSYMYTVHDTMSKGLTFNNDVTVQIEGVTPDPAIGSDFNVIINSQAAGSDTQFDIVFDPDYFVTLPAGAAITIHYTATLNQYAAVGNAGNPNDVTLDYSNSPYYGSYAPTPKSTAIVYTFGINIFKYTCQQETAVSGTETATETAATAAQNGSINIQKNVIGGGDPNKFFNFTAVIGGDTYRFSLKDGENYTFDNVPIGTSYNIAEDDYSAEGYIAACGSYAGIINASQPVNIIFTNYYIEPKPDITTTDTTTTPATDPPAATSAPPPSGSLVVSKTVIGGGDPDMAFNFTAWIDGVPQYFTLKNGESKTIDHIPVGTMYTVTEDAVMGYMSQSTNSTGRINEPDQAVNVDFVNYYTPQYGSLVVSKQVNGVGYNPDKAFDFTAVIGGVTQTFSLKNGESKTFDNILVGTAYTVREADYSSEWFSPMFTASSGTISMPDQPVYVNFVNYYSGPNITVTGTGSLVISKMVVDGTDPDQTFNFTATIGSDKQTFSLKDGQSYTIGDIPVGTYYTVQEVDCRDEGYDAWGGVWAFSGWITTNDPIKLPFVNYYGGVPTTTASGTAEAFPSLPSCSSGGKALPLPGAVFHLRAVSGSDKSIFKVSLVSAGDDTNPAVYVVDPNGSDDITTPASGKVCVNGLDAGTYYLVEKTAPDGYNKLTDEITVVITHTDGKGTGVTTVNGAVSNIVFVENNTGSLLPPTGGIGNIIFYIVGAVLTAVLVAVFAINRKRRILNRQ